MELTKCNGQKWWGGGADTLKEITSCKVQEVLLLVVISEILNQTSKLIKVPYKMLEGI